MNPKIFYTLTIVNFFILIGVAYFLFLLSNSGREQSIPGPVQVLYYTGGIENISKQEIQDTSEIEVQQPVNIISYLNEQDKLSGNIDSTGTGAKKDFELPDSFTVSYGGTVSHLSLENQITGYEDNESISIIFDINIQGDILTSIDISINSDGNVELDQAFDEFETMIGELQGARIIDIIASDETNLIFIELKNTLGEYLSQM